MRASGLLRAPPRWPGVIALALAAAVLAAAVPARAAGDGAAHPLPSGAGAAGDASTPQSAAPDGADAKKRAFLASFRSSVVRVDSRAVDAAPSAASLGERRSGSGVILESQLVLTIGYLLLETESVDVTTASGKRIPGSVAGYDHATGFGLVRTVLPLDGARIELGDSDRVAERDKVLTIGQGEGEATEVYVLSRKPFAGSWEYLIERPIFTFPPVNNWSGSALIGQDGKLVGVGSLIVQDAAAERRRVPGNMFVPVNLLKPILEDLRTAGRRSGPVQPWLGMATEWIHGNLVVVRVSRDAPAEIAGIEPGDVVVAVDGERVTDQAGFYRRLWSLGPAGTEVTLRVLRAGSLREVRVHSIDRMEALSKPRGV